MDQDGFDSAYYERRAEEEQAAAERAGDERARLSHEDLARRYLEAARSGVPFDEDEPEQDRGVIAPEFRIIQ